MTRVVKEELEMKIFNKRQKLSKKSLKVSWLKWFLEEVEHTQQMHWLTLMTSWMDTTCLDLKENTSLQPDVWWTTKTQYLNIKRKSIMNFKEENTLKFIASLPEALMLLKPKVVSCLMKLLKRILNNSTTEFSIKILRDAESRTEENFSLFGPRDLFSKSLIQSSKNSSRDFLLSWVISMKKIFKTLLITQRSKKTWRKWSKIKKLSFKMKRVNHSCKSTWMTWRGNKIMKTKMKIKLTLESDLQLWTNLIMLNSKSKNRNIQIWQMMSNNMLEETHFWRKLRILNEANDFIFFHRHMTVNSRRL